jgi:hypothetical protein
VGILVVILIDNGWSKFECFFSARQDAPAKLTGSASIVVSSLCQQHLQG